jgi:GTP-binding protein
MIIRNVTLETVCGITSTIPDNALAEVAFAGKSNVGKSSLINALMNRKALARTSAQPGKTQTINFYNINDKMYLVDLPGYGYANAGVEIKAKWGQMIENYLKVSKQLRAVFLLIDIRHDPSENDAMMYDWMLHQGYAPIIIATKADKLKRAQIPKHVEAIKKGLSVEPETVIIPFSAETKQGREDIWELIDRLVLSPEEIEEERERQENAPKSGRTCRTSGTHPNAAKRQVSGTHNSTGTHSAAGQEADTAEKKPRWKAIGKPVAKKTQKNTERKAERKQQKNASKPTAHKGNAHSGKTRMTDRKKGNK